MTIKELWHINSEKTEIITREYAVNDKQSIWVKSLYSLISTGTERIVCSGNVPNNLHNQMQVQAMMGSFDFPIKYGYSMVGKVIEGPHELLNKSIHLLHPHQNYFNLNGLNYSILPENIPPKRAILASNMETAINVLWDSKISAGDKVLISGFGIVGALIAMVVKAMPAVTIEINEPDLGRRAIAEKLGFSIFSANESAHTFFDVAINAAPFANSLQTCMDYTVNEGLIVEASWYGNKSVELNLGNTFHTGHKRIISSQVSKIPLEKSANYNYQRRKEVVFKLLEDPFFDLLPLSEIAFNNAPKVFEDIRTSNYTQFCTFINYQ